MGRINFRRVWIGGIVGWLVWMVWSGITNFFVLMPRYAHAQEAGQLLKDPRYSFFLPAWFGLLLVLALVSAWLYAAARTTLGAGPVTALKLGLGLGFAAGFPLAFSLAAWAPMSRVISLWWMLELWIGAILATFTAGWLYRD